jgi:hypothetical protein
VVGLVEEMEAGLQQRPAGLVPQQDLLTDRIRTDVRAGSFERCRHPRVRQCLAGDASRVEGVGLALTPAASLLGRPCRTHITDIDASFDEEHRRVTTDTRRILDPEPGDRTERLHPFPHRPMPNT